MERSHCLRRTILDLVQIIKKGKKPKWSIAFSINLSIDQWKKVKWSWSKTRCQEVISFVHMFGVYCASSQKAKMPQQKSRISWNLFSPYKEWQRKLNSHGLACWNNQTWSYQPFHQSSGEYIPWQPVQIQRPHGVCCIPERQNIKTLFPTADYDTVILLLKLKKRKENKTVDHLSP